MNKHIVVSASSALDTKTAAHLRGKRIVVTGACGTIGQELITQLLNRFEPELVIGLDNNESELAYLHELHRAHENSRFFLCDVRDQSALLRQIRQVHVVFHAAAYKHVYICERSPMEAIQTNILGVQNVIQSALTNSVAELVFTSSDKAVNPTNVMGTSKLMGERLVTAASVDPNHAGVKFLSTRFGNVLGSRGSVIPLFLEQIRKGGPVTLSDPAMTRFVMTLDESVRLTIASLVLGKPGDVVITKMPAIRVTDLIEVMIRERAAKHGFRPTDIAVKVVGKRPGEKLYEELMNDEEIRRSVELEQYFVVRPAIMSEPVDPGPYEGANYGEPQLPYTSANVAPLSQDALADLLYKSTLI
jgi:FlaA1/EpsC-like NDP-sugar epimerase